MQKIETAVAQIRVKLSTRKRLKVRAAKENVSMAELIDKLLETSVR